MISDAHEGIKAAVAKVFKSTWQLPRALSAQCPGAHAGKGQRQMVLALINTVFAQDTQEAAAVMQWRVVADQLREKFPRLATVYAYPEMISGGKCARRWANELLQPLTER